MKVATPSAGEAYDWGPPLEFTSKPCMRVEQEHAAWRFFNEDLQRGEVVCPIVWCPRYTKEKLSASAGGPDLWRAGRARRGLSGDMAGAHADMGRAARAEAAVRGCAHCCAGEPSRR